MFFPGFHAGNGGTVCVSFQSSIQEDEEGAAGCRRAEGCMRVHEGAGGCRRC